MTRTHLNRVLLPRRTSRARRVLDALYVARQPVEEKALMAAHGLDRVPATIWRQGPYKSLENSHMIERDSAGRWSLTAAGLELMELAKLGAAAVAELEPARLDLVPPRTAPPFRPLARRPRMELIREGALDFLTIPSLYTRNA